MIVTVERLGHRGDGVAPGPVFVPGALPGEAVEGEVIGDRMIDPRIVVSSPDRVSPPCPHYLACGGCSLMHAHDDFIAGWKQDIVRQSLAGLCGDAAFRPVMTSPERSRRRATFAGRRTRSGAIAGFHGRASGTITEIPECRLLHPSLAALGPLLRFLTISGASRRAEIALTGTIADNGVDLAVKGGKPLDEALISDLAAHASAAGITRLTWDGLPVIMAALPVMQFGSARVPMPPGAFLQATREGEKALTATVAEAVGAARRVADLFAGCGTFALSLAARCEVHAVETDDAMLAALDTGWRTARGLHRVSTEARDLFRRPLQPEELRSYDAVVIDPPRAGAEAQFEMLAQSSVNVVAAVSCNPVTFARDAQILTSAGFRIDWIQVVDQFRWSPHIEMAARFSR